MNEAFADATSHPAGAPSVEEPEAVFELDMVSKTFGRRAGMLRGGSVVVHAVDEVSLRVYRGEALGLVGESGSGKTTLGRLLVGLEAPSSGAIRFEGRELGDMRKIGRTDFRRHVQMVYQNPFAALNPLRTIRDSLLTGYRARGGGRSKSFEPELIALLERVGLHRSMLNRYPHQLSGGQRQRVVIARALTIGPEVLIADEPVSALDVSLQAQVLNLLNELKEDLALTVVMVTHDLRVANFFCNRIAVMYLGRIVELGQRSDVMGNPRHPYTQMLLAAAPSGDPETGPGGRLWSVRTLARDPLGKGAFSAAMPTSRAAWAAVEV